LLAGCGHGDNALMWRKPAKGGRWQAWSRSRAVQLAVFPPITAGMGYICARMCMLLADVRPYLGWQWYAAVAGGIVVAIALPWALFAGFRGGLARWTGWLLIGCMAALTFGLHYYLGVRFTPPLYGPAVLPAPRLLFLLLLAGLTVEALTYAAVTLLMVLVLAWLIAPGQLERWRQARRSRRSRARRARPRNVRSIPYDRH
jgi:hypothetical protein